jgi:hypothetical protein
MPRILKFLIALVVGLGLLTWVGTESGHDDDRYLGICHLDPGEHVEPIHVGHAQVGEDGVERGRTEPADGLLAACHRFGIEAVANEIVPHALGHFQVVVDNQDA